MFYSSERSNIINSISGMVERITYKNTEDGFIVIKIKTKEEYRDYEAKAGSECASQGGGL